VGACSILGLFVPLYCLLAGFGLKEATALSQAAIAGKTSTATILWFICGVCLQKEV
jgi:uncharacterized membrane protein YfcA